MSVEDILKNIPENVDGVTISGGEPFLQTNFLLSLVRALREKNYSIVVFSGFYLREIKTMPQGTKVLEHIDALIDGRFEESAIAESGLHGSSNQTIHLFTDLFTEKDFEPRDTEIWIDENGEIRMTGFPTESLLEKIK
jgi:anaerobic ribonucleoside-triphosphate reductase activating protein